MMPNMPSMIDRDTPAGVYSRKGFDGNDWQLVFSDEFETAGRTFYPGDDPYWEAVGTSIFMFIDIPHKADQDRLTRFALLGNQ